MVSGSLRRYEFYQARMIASPENQIVNMDPGAGEVALVVFVRRLVRVLLLLLFLPALDAMGQVQTELKLSGTFRPSAPPEEPARRKVGSGCVVDLMQTYDLEGSLVGEMVIDFRIFVAGDCTQPPGTFDEHWISYGTYVVRIRETEHAGTLIYLATVKAGKVEGTLALGGELSAELEVVGNFEDGYLSYSGAQRGERR